MKKNEMKDTKIEKMFSGNFNRDMFNKEFDNYKKALECYDSKEYQEAHEILKGHAIRHHQIVEGS